MKAKLLDQLARHLRALGPAVPHTSTTEAFRAGLGAIFGLLLAGLFLLPSAVDTQLGLYLIAPFGASSVLLFAAPNSPLAQPWSAVVGNVVSALAGVSACLMFPDATLRIPFAVGLAISAMMLLRALHPPGGAVAMTAALAPEATLQLGWMFAIAPVACGTVALACSAALYARLTGRRYPLRQFAEVSRPDRKDRSAVTKIGLNEAELVTILERYNQTLNLGVADLARLIGAAEMILATHGKDHKTAQDIMSRDLIVVGPGTPIFRVAELFRAHNFTSIPVVGDDNHFIGVIFQIHLIRRADDLASRKIGGFTQAMAKLLKRQSGVLASDIMAVDVVRCAPDTAISALLPLMAEGHCDAVPVIDGAQIVGIVTRTDLIAAIAQASQPAKA